MQDEETDHTQEAETPDVVQIRPGWGGPLYPPCRRRPRMYVKTQPNVRIEYTAAGVRIVPHRGG